VTLLQALAAVIGLGLLVYLVVALLYPEKLS
jgi:K+-transporting ATPase KdpF subunit